MTHRSTLGILASKNPDEVPDIFIFLLVTVPCCLGCTLGVYALQDHTFAAALIGTAAATGSIYMHTANSAFNRRMKRMAEDDVGIPEGPPNAASRRPADFRAPSLVVKIER